MNILVTGGAGFIGSHIVDKLISMGHTVTVIDNESSESNSVFYWNNKSINIKEDICDYSKIRKYFDGIDYVFHCAAESRIQPTILNPVLAMKTNVVGTSTILQCSREANVKKVMYSSTSAAYGLINIPGKTGLVEIMPEDCLNPYSVSKVAGEKICTMYTKLFNLKTVIFRYFNVYGEREPIKGPYAPVTGIFLRLNRDNKPLTITGDGSQKRDFVHVLDVVDANIAAMQTDIDDRLYGEIFNVGSGKNYSIIELANMISYNIEYIDMRPGEAKVTLANIDKIKKVLEWQPKRSIEDYIMVAKFYNKINKTL